MKSMVFKIGLGFLAALMVMVLVFPQPVSASSGTGTGTVIAHGSGHAGMRGAGAVTVSGIGVLMIRDMGGDAQIDVDGFGMRMEGPDGWIRYIGRGKAIVSGSNIQVSLTGINIDLRAAGNGKFIVRGAGWYVLNGVKDRWPFFTRTLPL